jgi:hypothetical protein
LGRRLEQVEQQLIKATLNLFVIASLIAHGGSMTWKSGLEQYPEHARIIGMISIENANLELALARIIHEGLAAAQ